MKKTKLFLLLSSMCLLASCGSKNIEDLPIEQVPPQVRTVALDRDYWEMQVGSTKTINFGVYGIGNFDKGVAVESSNPEICTVAIKEGENSLILTSMGVGEATITLKSTLDSSKFATLIVKVSKETPIVVTPKVTGISANPNSFAIEVGGDGVSVNVEVAGEGEYDKGVVINNNNPEFCSINKTELQSGESFSVEPNAVGFATIEITSNGDKTITKKVNVRVDPNSGEITHHKVVLDSSKKEIYLNDEVTVNVKSTTGPVSWSIYPGDEEVIKLEASDDNSATVKGTALGAGTLIATTGNFSATCLIQVGTDPDPSFTNVYYKVNDGDAISLTKTDPLPADATCSEQFTGKVNVNGGDRIDFYGEVGGVTTLLSSNVQPSGDDLSNLIQNNLKAATIGEKDWTVLKSGTDLSLYFERHSEQESISYYTFWLSGGPEMEVDVPRVKGIGGDWTNGVRMTPNGDGGEYKLIGVSLQALDAFKLNYGDIWAGYDNLKQDCRNLASPSDPDRNIIINSAGKYNIYWNPNNTKESIWIEVYDEPIPEYIGYAVSFDNGDKYPLTKMTEYDPIEGLKAKYKIDVVYEISAQTRVDFYGIVSESVYNLIDSKIGPNPDDLGNKVQNNIKPATTGGIDFKVLQGVSSGTLYLEIYEDWFGFWLTGGPAIKEGYFLKVNGIPSIPLAKNEGQTEYDEYYATGVSLTKGDRIELYDGTHDATWMVGLDTTSGALLSFNQAQGYATVIDTWTYDFYVKMISGSDSIYVAYNTPLPAPTYKVSFGGGEAIALDVDESELPPGTVHQWSTNLDLVEGQSVSFFKNDVAIDNIAAGEGNNNVTGSSVQGFSIVESYKAPEGHKTLYLKQLESGSYEIWANGKSAPLPAWKVVGTFNNWSYADGEQMVLKEGSETEYTCEVSFNIGDEFKIYDGSGDEGYRGNWKTAGEGNAISIGLASIQDNCNLKINATGIYTIYFETGDNDPGIFVTAKSVISVYDLYNGSEHIEFVYDKVENGNVQYKAEATATAGMTFEVYSNSKAVECGNDEASSKDFTYVSSSWVYAGKEASADYDFYLKQNISTGALTLYIGGHQIVYKDHVMHGLFAPNTSWSDIDLKQNTEKNTEFYAHDVELTKDDVFAVHMTGDVWYKYSDVKEGCKTLVGEDAEGNIKITETGKYDIYSDLTDDGGHIWIAKSPAHSISFKVSTPIVGLNKSLDIEVLTVRCSDITYVSSDEDVLTVDSKSTDSKLTVNGIAEGKSTITATASDGTKATIEITVSSEAPTTVTITATVSDSLSWWYGSDIPLFAWVWSGAADGRWVQVTFTVGQKSGTFVVNPDDTGFLIVRCASGTTTPDWDQQLDVPGKIYNKSADVTIISGTTSYEISEKK